MFAWDEFKRTTRGYFSFPFAALKGRDATRVSGFQHLSSQLRYFWFRGSLQLVARRVTNINYNVVTSFCNWIARLEFFSWTCVCDRASWLCDWLGFRYREEKNRGIIILNRVRTLFRDWSWTTSQVCAFQHQSIEESIQNLNLESLSRVLAKRCVHLRGALRIFTLRRYCSRAYHPIKLSKPCPFESSLSPVPFTVVFNSKHECEQWHRYHGDATNVCPHSCP